MRSAGLTDSQKADLVQIWTSQSNGIISDSTDGNTKAMPLQDHMIHFTARLTSFFIHILHVLNDSRRCAAIHDRGKHSSLLEAFRPFFPSLGAEIQTEADVDIDIDIDIEADTMNAINPPPLLPRLAQGRHLVTMDHTQFLSELDEYEGNQYINPATGQTQSFGSFLYHRPNYGFCITNSAIALTLMTMQRRGRQHLNGNSLALSRSNSEANPHFVSPQSIIINVRFLNVYPSIEISDVKTDNAYKLITLRGRIIKVHPKRLRLLQADILCIKCGQQLDHMFLGGRYELPNRCNLINDSGKKCPGQKFELLRRTAKYIDCQMLKLQEEDNVTSAAGRTPRHIELEVTHDLVDVCHAGDCVRVVGVVHAMNSAVKAGRKGKQAVETSTYHLFVKANSILNTTAELHEKKNARGGDGGDGSRGLTFTEEQLDKITKVAHAGDVLHG
jgi:hypothetical protein